ncbi:MAG: hypothetical protein N2327_03305 [Caldimicrobium sp.]|nr:hypothetical protein [Caldimicrobium sp.]MCX7873445.1 hypothetical protein [Caldimicrobium sp.]MDW8095044.1 hypothetical protein [Caldimicrobium sp.]
MVYFIRAKTHYQYALSLWRDLHLEKKKVDPSLYLDIFSHGLKALYNLLDVSPQEKSLSLEEIILRILPTLSEEEKRVILSLKDLLLGKESSSLEKIREEMSVFMEILKESLRPIL